MRAGRPPLALGAYGKISTRRAESGRYRASAQLRTWDDEVHRLTVTGDTASGARELLKQRMAERLRTSELFVWRTLTADDPFHELVICWLDGLWSFSETSESTYFLCEHIVRTQLTHAFGQLTIREVTPERIQDHLAIQRARSEDAAASSHEVLELLLDFAVGEGVIASNPVDIAVRGPAPRRLDDLDRHRKLVRAHIALRREERRREAGPAGG